MSWFAVLVQDLRYALRGFSRSRRFTITELLVLAVAIGANTAIFSVMEAVLLRALPYRDAARVGPAIALRHD